MLAVTKAAWRGRVYVLDVAETKGSSVHSAAEQRGYPLRAGVERNERDQPRAAHHAAASVREAIARRHAYVTSSICCSPCSTTRAEQRSCITRAPTCAS